MKKHEERNSKINKVNASQSFSKDESSTCGSDYEDFEQHLDQQAKERKMENEKITNKSPSLQQFILNFISALNVMVMVYRTSKLSVMTAISRYRTILQKKAYIAKALPQTQVSEERLFTSNNSVGFKTFDVRGLI